MKKIKYSYKQRRAKVAAKALRDWCVHTRGTNKYSYCYDNFCPSDCPYYQYDPLDIWGPEPPPCYLKETWRTMQVSSMGPLPAEMLEQLWENP